LVLLVSLALAALAIMPQLEAQSGWPACGKERIYSDANGNYMGHRYRKPKASPCNCESYSAGVVTAYYEERSTDCP
jgi:hypothetical protein